MYRSLILALVLPGLLLPLAERAEAREDKKGYIGVQIGTDKDSGRVVVIEVLEKSPAEAAGLKKDDQILKAGDLENPNVHMFVDKIQATKPGDEIVIKVQRGNEEKEIKVKVGEKPNEP